MTAAQKTAANALADARSTKAEATAPEAADWLSRPAEYEEPPDQLQILISFGKALQADDDAREKHTAERERWSDKCQ